MNIKELRRR